VVLLPAGFGGVAIFAVDGDFESRHDCLVAAVKPEGECVLPLLQQFQREFIIERVAVIGRDAFDWVSVRFGCCCDMKFYCEGIFRQVFSQGVPSRVSLACESAGCFLSYVW